MFGRITPVVRNLLIANAAILFLGNLLKIDTTGIFGLRYILADTFAPYQFITYMFFHGDMWHLISNMFALFIFGPLLEQFWGSKRFFIFYMITGIGAGIIYSGVNFIETRKMEVAAQEYVSNPDPELFNSFIIRHAEIVYPKYEQLIDAYAAQPDNQQYKERSINVVEGLSYTLENIPMVGASGAIFGILLAFGMLFPNTVLMLLFPPIPIKAKYLVAIYGFIELFTGVQKTPGDNVAHFAHLAGMLVAFILLKIWQNQRTKFY